MSGLDEEESSSISLLPPKRKKYTNFERCIICQTDTDERLRKPREASLKTLISALEIRDDDVFHRLKPDIDHLSELPVLWHSKCYETCTSTHNLLSVQRRKYASSPTPSEASVSSDAGSCVSEVSRVSRSQTSSTDWSKCIFCKSKTHKKVKEMVAASTFQACDAILHAAEQQGDEDMLLALHGVNNDLVAAEAKYHKACYSSYVSKTNLKFTGFKEGKLETTYAEALKQLAAEITTDILAGKAFHMRLLLNKYKTLLEEKGVAAESYSSQRLKLRLKKHFAGEIVFHQPYDHSKSEFLYSSSISLHDVINAAYQKAASTTVEEPAGHGEAPIKLDRDERTRLLYRTARLIKSEINECQGISVRPPNASDLSGNFKVSHPGEFVLDLALDHCKPRKRGRR